MLVGGVGGGDVQQRLRLLLPRPHQGAAATTGATHTGFGAARALHLAALQQVTYRVSVHDQQQKGAASGVQAHWRTGQRGIRLAVDAARMYWSHQPGGGSLLKGRRAIELHEYGALLIILTGIDQSWSVLWGKSNTKLAEVD